MAPIKRARSPRRRSDGSSLLESFARHGWVCVPDLLSPSELRVLQAECTSLYARENAESIAAQGCVLDVLAQCPIGDSDAARTVSSSYLSTRAKQLKSSDLNGAFERLLFEKLPTIAGQLTAARDASVKAENVFFFNEHYVVKPPNSHVEFRWHRDDDEQLAMCVHRESIHPYVSAWCALDDVTSANGALQFVSLDVFKEEDVESLKRHASGPVTAKKGDVLFFMSNVWHFSSCNESEDARRAFYAQYSIEKITARPNDPSPLSFAVPCKTTSSAALLNRSTDNGAGEVAGAKKMKRKGC